MIKVTKFLINSRNIITRTFGKTVDFYFIDKDDKKIKVTGDIGKNVLEVAHENNIDLEGACEASLACSTCHVIFENDLYNKLNDPDIEEEDLLDQAFGLTLTSRLGCQVTIDKNFENQTIRLPKMTRNMYVDGFNPKPH